MGKVINVTVTSIDLVNVTSSTKGLNSDKIVTTYTKPTGDTGYTATSLIVYQENDEKEVLYGVSESLATIAAATAQASQAEIDAIEAGAGLATDGTYSAPGGTSFLGATTTIKGAAVALDTALGTTATPTWAGATIGANAASNLIILGRTSTGTAAGTAIQIDATTCTYPEGLELRYNMADWADVATFTSAKGMYLRMETSEANAAGSVYGMELYGVTNNVTVSGVWGLLAYGYIKGATAKNVATAYGVQAELTWDAGAAATTLGTEACPILAKITGGTCADYTKIHGIIVRSGDMDGASRTYGNGILIEDDAAQAGAITWTTGINLTSLCTTGISITNASTAINILIDSTSAANTKDGIYISKDLTNATAAGALAANNEAFLVQSVNATSASASGAITVTGYLTSVQQVNSTAVAQADVYNASALCGLSYSATTTGAGTATNSSNCLEIDYNITETAGTLSNTAFNVAKIDFDSTGTPAFASGTYSLLDINGSSNASSIDAAATVTLNGANIDVSAIVVTDADLVLNGLAITMPTAAGSIVRGISLSGAATSHIYSNTALIVDMPVTAPGAGFDTAGGVKYVPYGKRGANGMYVQEIYVDLATAAVTSKNTLNDIIGEAAGGAAHIGQITAAINGAVKGIEVVCLEAPATGDTDIDIASATAATGVYDDDVTALAGYAAILTAGGAWTAGMVKVASALPAANSYLYLSSGNGGTAGAYSAGKFLIRIYGF